MGVGKTTVGRLVAERAGRPFVDTDEAICARTGRTVRELWEAGGEAAYRKLESQVVLDSLGGGDHRIVVGAAAGVILDPAVRDALGKPDVLVVWLHADPAVLAGRVHPGDHRPLLKDRPRDVLAEMDAERASLYRSVADAVVETGGRDPAAIASQVIQLIGERDSG